MNYTEQDLATLRKAIASGLQEVRYGDKTVRYQSVADMLRAEQQILSNLSAQAGRKRRVIYRLRNIGKGI